jgi:hypothetical protein
MELKRAIEIIQFLADGVSPYTGEVFDDGSVFQNADTIRALYVALEEMKHSLSRFEKHKGLPEKTGKPWTSEENTTLVTEFDSGMDIATIAARHDRTIGAINARLMKLGKIQI